ICERIGVPVEPLPHLRRARDRHEYRDYYTDELRDIVAEAYRPDIETFGYSF
ncbi:MAG: sulfotransferase, partial [Deltaproteobacteria bacterium]